MAKRKLLPRLIQSIETEREVRTIIALMLLSSVSAPALADDVAASAPSALSVTVYRAPERNGGGLVLESLGGFALIKETRIVRLPAGESRLRFEGVLDGIIPESAIVSGLPSGVIEKNRDAALLSPSALMRAAVDRDIILRVTNRKTGKVQSIPAKLRSANEEGVVFETAQGLQALQCSGLPETFSYSSVPSGLSAKPTLSVLTRSPKAITATVTLTYLAEKFDWAADYTASLNPDGKTMDLGAWITLANGNSISLPMAQTQIVAGKLNRAQAQRFFSRKPRAVARCWPSATTSNVNPDGNVSLVRPYGFDAEMDGASSEIMVTSQRRALKASPPAAMAMAYAAPAPPPPPEQLGDLKLYRVPFATNILANQMKQTRLMEQRGISYNRLYRFDIPGNVLQWQGALVPQQTLLLLKTKNDKAHQLGLPLPAGQVTVEQVQLGRVMFVGQPALRDLAEGEDVEFALGQSPEVQVKVTPMQYMAKAPELTKLAPGLLAAYNKGKLLSQAEITNATPMPQQVELRIALNGASNGTAIEAADQPIKRDGGNSVISFTVPANGSLTVTYAMRD